MNFKHVEQKKLETKAHSVWFHLYKAQNQAKLLYQDLMQIWTKTIWLKLLLK